MRLPDWEPRFAAYISAVASRPFRAGRHDCALFAAGGIDALTGINPAADWLGRYSSQRAGIDLIRGTGYRDHVDFAARHFPAITRAEALPGDLVVIRAGRQRALGLLQGAAVYVPGRRGLGLVALDPGVQIMAVR